jgi:putative NADH-flavin reductase
MAHIIVFGASGNCGRLFVERAAEHGHSITAVARSSTSDLPRGVELVLGDVLDASFVARVMRDHDIVVSALGMRYAHPWATRRSPDDFTERATRNIVDAMKSRGIDRLVVVSAAGVGDSRVGLNWPMRLMLKASNVGVAYADLERMEAVLAESGLDWHAVRPTTLTHGDRTGRAHATDSFGVTATIPRADVAEWLLHEVESPANGGIRTPMITVT